MKPASEALSGDICLYDRTNDGLIIVDGDTFSTDSYPTSSYTPIGIVVIPGSHDVYGTGECAIMSLVSMDYNNPDVGNATENVYMCWGGYGDDTSLRNYDSLNYIGIDSTLYDSVQGVCSTAHLPSDLFTALQCPHDTDTYYHETSNAYQAPSPFLTNGSRNPMYYQTESPASTYNAFHDFDGFDNTATLCDLAIYWTAVGAITNGSGSGYYPAACCCWQFYTDGTYQGEWYLPSMGELGYVMPNLEKISTAMLKVGGLLLDGGWLFSSSEENSLLARSLHVQRGYISNHGKDENEGVRAFLRVR